MSTATATSLGAITKATPAELAVAEDNATVMNLPAADLDISVDVGGERYHLAGVDSQVTDALALPVRLIESGRWVQRFDVERLILENDKKERLGMEAGLRLLRGQMSCRFPSN